MRCTLEPLAGGKLEELYTAPQTAIEVWVIPTNEELMIARHALSRLDG
jgi:acetate kinase